MSQSTPPPELIDYAAEIAGTLREISARLAAIELRLAAIQNELRTDPPPRPPGPPRLEFDKPHQGGQ